MAHQQKLFRVEKNEGGEESIATHTLTGEETCAAALWSKYDFVQKQRNIEIFTCEIAELEMHS